MFSSTIYEVTALVIDARLCDCGARRVLWTGRNCRKAVAQKALARVSEQHKSGGVYTDFRVDRRDEMAEVV